VVVVTSLVIKRHLKREAAYKVRTLRERCQSGLRSVEILLRYAQLVSAHQCKQTSSVASSITGTTIGCNEGAYSSTAILSSRTLICSS
jgi:hypothetical protein